jgi:hypothetical protein
VAAAGVYRRAAAVVDGSVGVDGRRVFPRMRAGLGNGTHPDDIPPAFSPWQLTSRDVGTFYECAENRVTAADQGAFFASRPRSHSSRAAQHDRCLGSKPLLSVSTSSSYACLVLRSFVRSRATSAAPGCAGW